MSGGTFRFDGNWSHIRFVWNDEASSSVEGKLEVSSRNLDCNQLINSLSFPEDTLQAEVDTTASSLELFVIPKNLDFELQTNLKRVKYDKMIFEDVRGAVDIRNQAVHLKD